MPEKRQFGTNPFIAGMATAAAACFAIAFSHWHSSDPVKFICYMAAALLASPLKVSLPSGTLSVNFLFTLLSILEMSLPETLLIGLISTLGPRAAAKSNNPLPDTTILPRIPAAPSVLSIGCQSA